MHVLHRFHHGEVCRRRAGHGVGRVVLQECGFVVCLFLMLNMSVSEGLGLLGVKGVRLDRLTGRVNLLRQDTVVNAVDDCSCF